MIYLLLFYEFFKIGLFSYGGGYATIPFLYRLALEYGWYTTEELKHMTAIAAITPGPVGINVATYSGYKTAGILGSVIATLAEVLPSLIIVIIISAMLNKFKDNSYVKTVLATLKPVSCALLLAVTARLLKSSLDDTVGLILLAVLLLLGIKLKKEPVFYFIIAGLAGIVLRTGIF